MSDQRSPGQTFNEVQKGPVAIAGASTAIGGIVAITQRGPTSAVLIGGINDFDTIFGGEFLGSPARKGVKMYFDHGGQALYVARALHVATSAFDAVAAAAQLQGDGPASNMLLNASSLGAHGNTLSSKATRDTTLVGTTGAIAASPATTSQTLTSGSIGRLYVGAQLNICDSVAPTTHMRVVVTAVEPDNNRIYYASSTPTGAITIGDIYLEEFTLAFYRSGTLAKLLSGLAMSPLSGSAYFKGVVNTGNPADPVVVITDNLLAPTNVVDPRPLASTVVFTAGADGTTPNDADHTGDATLKTGLYAFDKVDDINQVAIPGRCTLAVHQAIIAWCDARANTGHPVFGVMAVNDGMTAVQEVTYVTTTANLYSSNADIYTPWLKITDPSTGFVVDFPPECAIMGVYARTDAARGVHKAPAGTPDGQLVNVVDVVRKITVSEYDTLYPVNINAILALKGRGICLYGSRTLSQGDFQQISVRRLINWIKMSLKDGMPWVNFEPNDDDLRARVRKSVGAFLLRAWRASKLKGTKAADAFFIICDRSNNSIADENVGKLTVRIGVAVKRPVEFVEWDLELDTRALDAELAAAGVT